MSRLNKLYVGGTQLNPTKVIQADADNTIPLSLSKFNSTNTGVAGNAQEITDAIISNRPNGLEDPSKFSRSYNPLTRVFTITGASGAYVWCNGKRYDKEGVEETDPHTATSGNWFCYYDENGALTVSDTVWDIDHTAQIIYCIFNATTEKAISFEERHPSNTKLIRGMDEATHKHQHLVTGTRIISGLLASGTVPDTRWLVGEGLIVDEDIYTDIAEVTSGGPYRILYRSGGENDDEWDWIDNSTNGLHSNGTNLYYNQLTGGSWALTAITTNNRWVNYWIYAAPVIKNDGSGVEFQTFAIMGQTLHTSIANARAEDPSIGIKWGDTALQEFVLLARVTYRRVNGGYSVNANLEEVVNIRSNRVELALSGVGSHNALTGRSDPNAHPATAISYDVTVLEVDHSYTGDLTIEAVGESVVFGDLLYFNWTDKEYKKANKNNVNTMPVVAIALESKTDGQACTLLRRGFIRDDSWTFASAIVMTGASGAPTTTLPTTTGDQVQRIGTAIDTSKMWFEPISTVVEVPE